jgi:hypothetical protein
MGESRHPLGPYLGRFLFTYAQGSEYANMVKGWVAAGGLVTIALKQLGVSNATTIWTVVLGALSVALLTYAAGRYHVKWGGAREQVYRANLQDPWKVRSLEILERIDAHLDAAPAETPRLRPRSEFPRLVGGVVLEADAEPLVGVGPRLAR